MKSKLILLISMITLSAYSQDKKLIDSKDTKELSKHVIGVEAELIGFETELIGLYNKSFEYSYRYLLNEKWNLKASLDLENNYSYNTSEVLSILNINEYVGVYKVHRVKNKSINLGVERNFKTKYLTLFTGLDVRYSFHRGSKFESISKYSNITNLVNENAFFEDSTLGTYYREVNSSSIGVVLTGGIKYEFSKRLSAIVKLKGVIQAPFKKYKINIEDDYYNGTKKDEYFYREYLSFERGVNLGLLFRI